MPNLQDELVDEFEKLIVLRERIKRWTGIHADVGKGMLVTLDLCVAQVRVALGTGDIVQALRAYGPVQEIRESQEQMADELEPKPSDQREAK